MFSTDKPITDVSEDKLGRSGFAERLAKAIINSFTGIMGMRENVGIKHGDLQN